jgi:hypothetical protein
VAAWQSPVRERREPRRGAVAGARSRVAVLLVVLAGCQAPEQPPGGGRNAPGGKPEPVTIERALPETHEKASEPPATVREKAGVGSGEKGRGYGGGPVTTPVAAYFSVRERLVFDAEIPHALDLYKATEGHAPRSQDEFMRDIVTANRIRLPTLPPGHRYVYDPKSEQLMVEHPKR